jgi:hypothetical protein
VEWTNYKVSNTGKFMETFMKMEEEWKNEIYQSCLKY